MTKSVSVQAQLIPAGQRFVVEAGQQIMVVAGIAIGVYTGVPAIPVPVIRDPNRMTAEEEAALNRTSTKASKLAPGYRKRSTTKGGKYTTDPVFKRIIASAIALVRTEGSFRPDRLREIVSIAKTDKSMWKVRDTLAALANDGTLTSSGGTAKRVYTRGPNFPTEQSDGAQAAA